MEQQRVWRTLNGRRLTHSIEEELRAAIRREWATGIGIRICIGTDSQVYGNRIKFATVITVLRIGRGGYMYIQERELQRTMTVKERMMQEVQMSVEAAVELQDLVRTDGVQVELHADINQDPCFKSQSALQEARGYAQGMGLQFRSKPHAFASSSCANKIVH